MEAVVSKSMDIEKLVESHQEEIWHYLKFLGCQNALADDLTQDTFIQVFQQNSELREAESAPAYLRTIARRSFFRHLKKLKKQGAAVADFDEAESVWQLYSPVERESDLSVYLEDCLKLLDGRSRSAIEYRYRFGLKRKEVGSRLGISEVGATMLLQRSKSTLRECIKGKISRE